MRRVSILVAIFLIAFACDRSENKAVPPVAEISVKNVSYRGGLVNFSIPSNWNEEYAEDGGGTFYEDSQNSGTLRLNVLTFATPSSSDDFDVNTEAQKTAAKYGGEAVVLREGEPVVRYDSQDIEHGEPITLRFWQVYRRVSDSQFRIAVFSYTLPSARFGDEKHVREMEMLDREIRNARFAKSLGTLQ